MNIYPSLSVSVTTTPQKLLTLLRAVDSTIAPFGREVTLQSDPANTGKNISVGGSSVTTVNRGYVLTPGDSRTYRSDETNAACPLAAMYVASDSGTAQLNVEVILK